MVKYHGKYHTGRTRGTQLHATIATVCSYYIELYSYIHIANYSYRTVATNLLLYIYHIQYGNTILNVVFTILNMVFTI